MTFKDLQKLVQSQQSGSEWTSSLFERLRDKLFWIWDIDKHKAEDIRTKGDCCFNHIIGLPKKDGHDMPLLPYQRTLYEALQDHKHIWIKKSRGIGVTEFLLRYIAWCCFSKYTANTRVCVVTGPRIDLAEDLIARFKGLLRENIAHNDRMASTVAIVNNVRVEAFPSHHVDTMRGLDNVKFIYCDESDFFPPGGLMQQIEIESDSLYHKLRFDYTYGLEGPHPIYSKDQINKAKQSPDFEREYNLKYLGLIGNVFHTKDIETAIEKGKRYNPDSINKYSQKSVGLGRSGIVSVIAYSRTHWDKIVELEGKINSIPASNTDQRYSLYLKLRMYSINVPVSRSIRLTHRSVAVSKDDDYNSNPREYIIAEANYDSTLGLLVDM